MVLFSPSDPRAVDEVFSALSDPTRRAILARLSQGEASVTEIAAPFPLSLPGVAKHLRTLERAGLLEHYKTGRVRHCRLVPGRLQLARNWLDHYRDFWSTRLEALAQHMESEEES